MTATRMLTLWAKGMGLSCLLAIAAQAAPDAVVTFNEIHYHPILSETPLPEWIELHNQMAIKVDLSLWSLRGGISYTFPEGTVMEPGAYLVVSSVAGSPASAVGPLTGQLDNGGEQLRLHDRSGRMMDSLTYGDSGEWPSSADGEGPTLAKISPDTASDDPAQWKASLSAGGTPGESNFPTPVAAGQRAIFSVGSTWRVAPSTTVPSDGWPSPSFDSSSWAVQTAPLTGSDALYVRKAFVYSGGLEGSELALAGTLRGSAEFYLNGSLVGHVPAQNGSFNRILPAPNLLVGTNWLAVKIVAADQGVVAWDVGLSFVQMDASLANPATHQAGDIVINEILYQARPQYADPLATTPYAKRDDEFIELYNRSQQEIDLSGWKLRDAVSYDFPVGSTLAAGGFLVLTPAQYSGTLGNGSERLRLRNGLGDLVDEVRYFDDGRWPSAANGGGSSLELIDPSANNMIAESWAASREDDKSEWQTITYRGLGTEPPNAVDLRSGGTPAPWNEFWLGFLDGGECLIDDVSVIEDPAGAPVQVIQNGSFESDTIGAAPAKWRCLGTHKLSTVVAHPSGTGKCLHLKATAAFEHSYNGASTTFVGNRAINATKQYEISFKAKWITGSPQLNSRLHLNRVARTTILAQSLTAGTPSAANSRLVANAGPTCSFMRHSPAIPAASQAVRITADLTDPQGVRQVVAKYSVNAGPWVSVPMAGTATGRYIGIVPGQAERSVVQFYLEATDAAGGTSVYPASGASSRALWKVGDGGTTTGAQGLKNVVRLIMTEADADGLHHALAGVSNYRWPCTVIYNDRDIFYNAGVRLRAAPYGRNGPRAGWNISFGSDEPFRGIHTGIVIDGALNMPKTDGSGWLENTVGPSINELLYQVISRRAGDIPATYDDVVYFQTPRSSEGSRSAQLKMARFGDGYLEEWMDQGDEGLLYKQELIYYPYTTSVAGDPESLKNPYGAVRDLDIRSLGSSKDSYRLNWLVQNNADRDDFSRIMALGSAFDSPVASLYAATQPVLDADNWMRVLAFNSLTGLLDTYNMGLAHNMVYYVRPTDQRVMLFPWDQDHCFYSATNSNIYGIGSHRAANLIQIPQNKRLFLGHMYQFCQAAWTNGFADPWIDHLCAVGQRPAYASLFKNYISARRTFILSEINRLLPTVPFAITTNGGANFSVTTPSATIEGTAWVNVREIRVADHALPLIWLDDRRWRIVLPLGAGANAVTLTAHDASGQLLDSKSITITQTGALVAASASNLVISEIYYHPTTTETDNAEWLELLNTSDTSIDLSGVAFTAGVAYTFPTSPAPVLPSGARLILARDSAGYQIAFPSALAPFAQWGVEKKLSDSGDHLTLIDRAGGIIADFAYSDDSPWPTEADGAGYSLVLIQPKIHPDPLVGTNWRGSRLRGGSPGGEDSLPLVPEQALSHYLFATAPEWTNGVIEATLNVGADSARAEPEISTDLSQWTPAEYTVRREGPLAVWQITPQPSASTKTYVRFRMSQ